MDYALKELIEISKIVGGDNTLVLGGSGNTSVKTADGKYMYIKASGTALKDMNSRWGWRRLRTDSVMAILKNKSLFKMSIDKRQARAARMLLRACDDKVEKGVKPSIESFFHAFLGKYVVHLHPTAVLAYACAEKGRQELAKLFKDDSPPPLWVPYTNPGLELAWKIEKLIGRYKKQNRQMPQLIFLQNHGMVVTSVDLKTALTLVEKVIGICGMKLKKPKSASLKVADKEIGHAILAVKKAFFDATGSPVSVRYFLDDKIADFMAGKNARQLCSIPALTPDELTISNGPPIWLESLCGRKITKKLKAYITSGRDLPKSVLIKPLGLFVACDPKTRPLVKEVISNSLFICRCAARFGGVRGLTKRQRELIAGYKTPNQDGLKKLWRFRPSLKPVKKQR